jgi:signal transduction histidine kinase
MVTAVAVLFAACLVFTAQQWRSEGENLKENQQQITSLLAAPLARAVESRDPAKIRRLMQGFAVAPQVRDAQFLNAEGVLVEAYRRRGEGPYPNPTQIQSRTAVLSGGVRLGELVVRRDVAFFGHFLARYLAVAAALLFAAAGLSLFLGRALARRVVEPINRLVDAMHEVSLSGDFARTVTSTSDDELGRLTQSFNTLLQRLKAKDDHLRGAMHELTHARDAAEAANVQKSQFLANMSHEIRTPLNGVLAMAQIMALGEMSAEQRERVGVIRKSGEALLEILNDILDVSKIEAGKLELDIIEFDVEQTVRGAFDAFTAVADRKGLALDLDLTPSALGTRLGDPARLRQIITNLISNALKFTAEGGVSVTVDGVGPHGVDGIEIVVHDSGIGMPAEKLPLLFQKFTQLDASTTRQFGGTGLGLSICHELAGLMGGEVDVQSVEGEGSTFIIRLPLMRVAAAEEFDNDTGEALPEDQGRVLRVLAAEDNPTNQMVLTTIIQIFGADLTLVDNGQAAVEAWKDGDFDVILMDIQMPVLDGVGAARAIRAAELSERRSRTPIIALSANAMVHQVKEYMAAGMDGHVAKPIELPKLHAALETALSAREASRAAFAA